VKKSSKHIQDKPNNSPLYDGIKPTINHQENGPPVWENGMSSVKISENKVDKLPTSKAKGFEIEPVRNYADVCRNVDAIATPSSKKGAIWGSGLWPPEWTAVRSGFQQNKRSPTWKVEE